MLTIASLQSNLALTAIATSHTSSWRRVRHWTSPSNSWESLRPLLLGSRLTRYGPAHCLRPLSSRLNYQWFYVLNYSFLRRLPILRANQNEPPAFVVIMTKRNTKYLIPWFLLKILDSFVLCLHAIIMSVLILLFLSFFCIILFFSVHFDFPVYLWSLTPQPPIQSACTNFTRNAIIFVIFSFIF